MKDNYSIRAAARASLSGRWASAVITLLVFYIVTCLAALLPFVSVLVTIFFSIPLQFGVFYAFYDYFKHRNDNLLDNMFQRAFNRNYMKIAVVGLIYSLIIFLGSMLLLVPGIIASLGLALVPYILAEHPEMGSWEVICESWNLMKGHKAQLFWLMLSFIGWAFLCLFTLGIGFLWLGSYTMMALSAFYDEVKGQTLHVEPAIE